MYFNGLFFSVFFLQFRTLVRVCTLYKEEISEGNKTSIIFEDEIRESSFLSKINTKYGQILEIYLPQVHNDIKAIRAEELFSIFPSGFPV